MSSFTRLSADTCAYAFDITQSSKPGSWALETPRIDCDACFSTDPAVRMSSIPRISTGTSESAERERVDVESDLFLLNRKASHCPTNKFLPGVPEKLKNFPNCNTLIREDTRLSNPTCTLRCSGINRWEWLCKNPQDKALVPFDFGINNRIVVKDNHRPCLPSQIMEEPSLGNDNVCVGYSEKWNSTEDLSVGNLTWKTCV